jgi:hypothetical protein
MKRSTYPPFLAFGLVEAHKHDSYRPVATLKVSRYIHFRWEAYDSLIRQAKWELEALGLSQEQIGALYFDCTGIEEIYAVEPRGVRRVDGERVEAFLDSHSLGKRREVLIRQRRLVPDELDDMKAIYGPAQAAAPAAAHAEGVPA